MKRLSLQKLLIVFGSTFFSLLMAELCLRSLHPLNEINRYSWHPDLGHTRPPNKAGYYTTSEFNTYLSFNESGFRQSKPTSQALSNTFRVAFIGDSYVEGAQVAEEKVMSSVFQSLGEQSGFNCGNLEVRNFGISGYGTTQEYILLRKILSSYHPDLVILMFLPANDIKNNSIVLEQSSNDYATAYRPYFSHVGKDWKLVPPSSQTALKYEGNILAWMRQHIALIHTTYDVLSNTSFLSSTMLRLGLISQARFDAQHNIPIDFQVYNPLVNKDWQFAWDATFHSLKEIQTLLKAHHIPWLVGIIPNKEQIYSSHWTELIAQYPEMRDKHWDLQFPNRVLSQFLKSEDINFIDLKDALQSARDSPGSEMLYFPMDGHFTEYGQRKAGEAVFNFASSEKKLDFQKCINNQELNQDSNS